MADFTEQFIVKKGVNEEEEEKRSWAYRVIKTVKPQIDPDGNPVDEPTIYYAIYEVYYQGDKPVAYSSEPASVWWDGQDDPEWILARFKEALEQPFIDSSIFSSEG